MSFIHRRPIRWPGGDWITETIWHSSKSTFMKDYSKLEVEFGEWETIEVEEID